MNMAMKLTKGILGILAILPIAAAIQDDKLWLIFISIQIVSGIAWIILISKKWFGYMILKLYPIVL